MSDPKPPRDPKAPPEEERPVPPEEEEWQEEWSEEGPDDEALEWKDEDTSDEDTAWKDEDLLKDDRLDEGDEGWAPTEGDWKEEMDWSEEMEREPEPEDPLDEVPEQLSVVGWKTVAELPDLSLREIPTRCSTDCHNSTLHVEIRPGDSEHLRIFLQDREIEIPAEDESGELVTQLKLMVSGKIFTQELRLRATSGAPLLVLGRDALAGRFLVDVAR